MYSALLLLPLLLIVSVAEQLTIKDAQMISSGNGEKVFRFQLPGEKRGVKVIKMHRLSGDKREIKPPSGDGCPSKPKDCEELLLKCNQKKSGIYRIYPLSKLEEFSKRGFQAYCDMETDGGGWTVIQRRGEFGQTPDFFFKDWKSYKEGFGDLEKDFWLGNDKIYALSYQRPSAIRFDLEDFESAKRYAVYDDFRIEDEENNYKLHVSKYNGDAGDSFSYQNELMFTTKDRDNDNDSYNNDALLFKGGWWYTYKTWASLNGLYLKGAHKSWADGINWWGFKGMYYSLKNTEMKLRSSTFVKP